MKKKKATKTRGAGKTRKNPPARSSKQSFAARRKALGKKRRGVLDGARAYLSGPMDFVASRGDEKRNGWRTRVGQFMKRMGVAVFDPWNQPEVVGMPQYGKEDEFTTAAREEWTFEKTREGRKKRAKLCDTFFPTLHTDLRMTDISDFLVAYCPTNVYSVGTVHEIAMARLQHKPVLFVSPSVSFPALDELRKHLAASKDSRGAELLEEFIMQAAILENPKAIPSLWYMALLDGDYFFDGFGFTKYFDEFPNWKWSALDEREKKRPPLRPLLPYLKSLNKKLPMRYDLEQDREVENVDWLILDSKNLK